MTKQPAIKRFKHKVVGNLENSSYVMDNSFSIGCHQNVTKHSQDYTQQIFKNYLGD